jgi:hypothetical protein
MTRKLSGLCALIALGTLATTGPAFAGNVIYTGQGFNFDGTTYSLKDERCGLTGQNDADDGGTVAIHSCETPRCRFMRRPGAAQAAPL